MGMENGTIHHNEAVNKYGIYLLLYGSSSFSLGKYPAYP
jgi:hypothetical protein